jgi:glycosyltransferase involved in cell wall biosynthesis
MSLKPPTPLSDGRSASQPHVVHLETGRFVYGGARQVLYLTEHLPALGVRSTLVCAKGGEMAGRARAAGTEVIELATLGDVDVSIVWRFAALLRRLKPDLVHIHSRRGADVWGGLGAKLAGVPAVMSRRNDNREKRLALWLKYPLYRHVVAVAQGIKDVLVSQGVPGSDITVVHSAIDPAHFQHPRSRTELAATFDVDPTQPILGIAAQLIERKGHALLFEALQMLATRHPTAQLIVFGRGALSASLPALAARHGLQHRVRFAGFRADLERWIGSLDVLVHPAYTEGLANVCLQAAAAGVPCIGSRVGGIPEAVADGITGVLVPVGDAAALAAAIDRLLSDAPLRQRLGAAGPAHVESDFTPPIMAAGNRAVYRRLLGR